MHHVLTFLREKDMKDLKILIEIEIMIRFLLIHLLVTVVLT